MFNNFFDLENYLYILFLTGLFVFCSSHKHILLTLLSLDYIGLCLFMFFMLFLLDYWGDYYIILLFLCFMVCEAVLGLSILVVVIRCHGNDLVVNLSALKW